jgi:hypothetical protein
MKFPILSRLQFLVISILGNGNPKGKELHELIMAYGVCKTDPAFYQLMSRMVAIGFLKPKKETVPCKRNAITVVLYSVEQKGREAYAQTRAFYTESQVLAVSD